jgi:acyl-CoA reductase-like NAD-dependent aldehyde dehydrogenase
VLTAIDKIYLATGETITKIEPAKAETLDDTVACAAAAQRSWAFYEPLLRTHILQRVADALISGNVWVNSFNILPPGLPFGGAKHSGFGRENSIYTLDAYNEVKSVHITL